MQLPLAYLDATVVEEVPVDLWRQLFDAIGWPQSLGGCRLDLTHADILEALEQDTPSDEFLQALEALDVLGTEHGGEAIMTALQDQRLSREVLPAEASARELALRLFLAQREDAGLASVFARAQSAARERGDQRHYHEFLGRDARRVTGLDARCTELEAATREYAREHDLGDHVHVRAFEDDGTFTFHVIRSHRTQKPLAIVRGRSARATIEYRPVHSDLLRYEATSGRLRIAARAASVVSFFRRTLGEVLFDDPTFFSSDAVCSLRILQERGRTALDQHELPDIGRVWLTECLWERGDRDLVHLRSPDCFRNIEELHLPLGEGELLQAKLKVQVIGPSTRPVTVAIRVPSRIEISQKRHEALIDRFLTQVGIRKPRPSSAPLDLWSLAPWRHPLAVWRAVFGRETDRLIERGVLAPIRLDAVHDPDNPGAGRILRAIELAEGAYYGVSELPDIPSRSLTGTDLDGFMLVPEQLRGELRLRLGLSGGVRPWSEQDALLELGVADLDGLKLHLSYALRPPPAGTGDRIRQWASGATPALLVPAPAPDSSELPIATLEHPLPTRAEAIRSAVVAAGLMEQVSALAIARDGARLIVDTRRQMVWVDGVLITGLTPDKHPYRFVVRLARSTARVSQQEITEELSGARRDGTTTARQAKKAARDAIDAALSSAGRSLETDPFPSCGTGYYRCALPADVR